MSIFEVLQSIQRELTNTDEVVESFYDADRNHVVVTYRTGYQFRIEQVLEEYDSVEITASSEETDSHSKVYIGAVGT